MTQPASFHVHTRMSARSSTEPHRASSPLELLFDLTFVVAVAQIAQELAHAVAEGHAIEKLGPFLMVFFAIWWAWMNFTWFASAYDTDDVPYRVLTMVQMAGVLVLAAGVPAAFGEGQFTAITVGYLIMRLGLVAQWVRAAVEHPEGRRTSLRYAGGIAVVQALWLLRLLVPEEYLTASFVILALCEVAVPVFAARVGEPAWHPHHIAERYGLFTIIMLGESVLAATTGVRSSLEVSDVSLGLITVALASLVLLFALWWLYFLEPAGDGLSEKRGLSYFWGYSHYGIFAALAALGAGLEVAVEASVHHVEVSNVTVAYAIALPVGVFLVLLWAAHAPLVTRLVIRPAAILPAAVAVLLLPLASPVLGLPATVVLIALACVAVVTVTLIDKTRGSRIRGSVATPA